MKRKIIKRKWEPTFITDYEYIVVNSLSELSWSQDPIMKIDDELFVGHNLDEELANLIKNNIISLYNNIVELITIECIVGIVMNGQYVVGENNSGQMTDWILHNAL